MDRRGKRRVGWGRPLVLVALALLGFFYITRGQGEDIVGGLRRSIQRPDGTWALDDRAVIDLPAFIGADEPQSINFTLTALPSLTVGFQLRHQYGWGWERWVAERNYPSVGGPSLTPTQFDGAAQAAWVGLVKNPPHPELLPGFEMLRDGVATRTVGVVYYLRIVALWLGLGLIAAAVGVMLVRFGRVRRAKVRIGRIDLGLCGRCKYPILRGENGPRRCSECGADIEVDLALARSVVVGGVRGGSGFFVTHGPQPPAHP